MIEYRPFLNSDPPKLVKLWHQCRLGRGAAEGILCDVFETTVFSLPAFDRNGLIVACRSDEIVGYVHAGFGPNATQSEPAFDPGVICAVMVHPDYRRQGIGRELVSRAESYLKASGSSDIFAGPADPFDPFYVGIYGGSQPAGFLESDPQAAPFFQAIGYEPMERHLVFQRSLLQEDEPMNFRLMNVRRKMQLGVAKTPPATTWWWLSRYGNLDSLSFMLVPKGDGAPVAGITAVGMDFYIPKWQERVVGLTKLVVPEYERRHGYAQALVLDVCRKLREELITRVEMHVRESNEAGVRLLVSCGFERVDAGVVYHRKAE